MAIATFKQDDDNENDDENDDDGAGDDVDNHPPRNGLRWQKEREPSHDDKQARGQVGLEGQIISKLFLESEGRSGRSNYL